MISRMVVAIFGFFGLCGYCHSQKGPNPEFSTLDLFIKAHSVTTREISAYRVIATSIPFHTHSKAFLLVWTDNAVVVEKKNAEPETTHRVAEGQLDFYEAGTAHS